MVQRTLKWESYDLSHERFKKDIEKSIYNICMFPLAYPDCKYYYIKDENIRHAIINNYILLFKIYETKIVFLRFKYSKQNKVL